VSAPATDRPLRLAVGLDGAGWHPAAWRLASARPAHLFRAGYWVGLARRAETAGVDLITFEDALVAPGGDDDRTNQVRGRLDAGLVASLVAPHTSRIGLVPTVTTTHTEPFHVASATATLDWLSRGRAGWQAQVGDGAREAALFGWRRPTDDPADPFEEAADVIEVVRSLWDSWEDDAVVRDVATGRYIDRDRLHHVDFSGRWFSVKGPAIVPRPPQGQPVVAVAASPTEPAGLRLAARGADVVFVAPADVDEVGPVVAAVRAAEADAGRAAEPLRVFADLVVHLDADSRGARWRRDRLDELDGADLSAPRVPAGPHAPVFAGTPAELADRLEVWHRQSGGADDDGLDGFRLLPAGLPADLTAITDGLVPELVTRGRFRWREAWPTLRSRLGLPRPPNRYGVSP
jgi:alkanesulfonate monooxygenase SsuD/methylene tetrahydromethanopterin reductase-like flavin-dependent oxidoreductase (luciferase family)